MLIPRKKITKIEKIDPVGRREDKNNVLHNKNNIVSGIFNPNLDWLNILLLEIKYVEKATPRII